MEKVEVEKFVFNLNLLKRCYFYHIMDSNKQKFLNRNIYWLICVVFLAINLCIFLFDHVRFLISMDDTLNDTDIMMMTTTYTVCYLCIIGVSVLLYRSDKLWNLLDVTRIDFLTSKLCRKNINFLYDRQECIIKLSNLYYYIIHILFAQWTLYPLVIYVYKDNTSIHRYQNIFNLSFPISVGTYNQYFFIFTSLNY